MDDFIPGDRVTLLPGMDSAYAAPRKHAGAAATVLGHSDSGVPSLVLVLADARAGWGRDERLWWMESRYMRRIDDE